MSYALSAWACCFLVDSRYCGLLDFQIADALGLFRREKSFRQHPLLIGLRLGDCGRASRFGPLDHRVALGFGRGDIGIALDARDIGTAHVDDVVVLIADFLDGERNDFQPILVKSLAQVSRMRSPTISGSLTICFHRKLPDDAAQVAFHHQADQAVAFGIALGQKLFGRGDDRFRIGLHLDLRHRFHRHRDALHGVEILLRSDVERHQLQRQLAIGSRPWGK